MDIVVTKIDRDTVKLKMSHRYAETIYMLTGMVTGHPKRNRRLFTNAIWGALERLKKDNVRFDMHYERFAERSGFTTKNGIDADCTTPDDDYMKESQHTQAYMSGLNQIVLKINKEAATTLVQMCNQVSGDEIRSQRRYTNHIRRAIVDATGIKAFPFEDREGQKFNGGVAFKDDKGV